MDTKSVFTSKTIWGAIVMLVALVLSKKGHVISDELQSSTVVAITGGIGAVLVFIGRWFATKPLSVTGGVQPVKPSGIMSILLVVGLMSMSGGCSLLNKDPNLTPEQKVNNLKRDYELALPIVTALLDAGIIPANLADAVVFARKEARAFIDEALVQAKANTLNWEFFYSQAIAAVGRFLQFKNNGVVEAQRRGLDPKHLPTSRPVSLILEAPWKQSLSPCSA